MAGEGPPSAASMANGGPDLCVARSWTEGAVAERGKRVVIVGNGVAGTTCAETLRKNDANCEITLLGDERWPLYNRVALPPYIKGKATRQKVMMRTVEQHVQRGINLMLETRVT